MKRWICALVALCTFLCGAALAETERFVWTAGTVKFDASVEPAPAGASALHARLFDPAAQHDAFLTGLANHYGASFDLKFEGGARNSPDWQYSYSYSNGKRLYVTGNWGIALSTSHSRYAPFLDAGHGEVLEESREFLSFATPGQAMAQGTALLQAMGLDGEYSLRYFYSVNGERYRAAVEETRAAYAEMGKKFDAPELTDFGDDTDIAYVIAFEQSAQGLPIAASLGSNGIWSRPTSDMTVTPQGVDSVNLDLPVTILQAGEEQPVIPYAQAAAAMAEAWENSLLGYQPLYVRHIRLTYVMQRSDPNSLDVTLIPAWEFTTMEESDDILLEYNYVNAITGEAFPLAALPVSLQPGAD